MINYYETLATAAGKAHTLSALPACRRDREQKSGLKKSLADLTAKLTALNARTASSGIQDFPDRNRYRNHCGMGAAGRFPRLGCW